MLFNWKCRDIYKYGKKKKKKKVDVTLSVSSQTECQSKRMGDGGQDKTAVTTLSELRDSSGKMGESQTLSESFTRQTLRRE